MKHTERNDALLIVNVQNGFLNSHTKHLPARIEFLASWFDTVVISRYYNCPQEPSEDLIHLLVDWAAIAPEEIEFDHAFEAPRGAINIASPTYSILTTDLMSMLTERNIGHVNIAGMDTDISIRMCATELLIAGFDVSIHGDYCASTLGPWRHMSALKHMQDLLVSQDVLKQETRSHHVKHDKLPLGRGARH